MKRKKEKIFELTEANYIPYTAIDPTPGGESLGRAEFIFCPIIRKGKFYEVRIYRKQQRRSDRCWRAKFPRGIDKDTTIGFRNRKDFGYENLAPWTYGVCSEHKGLSFAIYVPDNTSKMQVRWSSIQTTFEFL